MPRFAIPFSLAAALAAQPVSAQSFKIASAADAFPIHGQVDLPSATPLGAVLLLPGSGNHSREFEYAVRGSGQRSYVFRDLSRALTAAGLAVVRYDERGVSCVGRPTPSDRDDRCHDPDAAKTISMNTLQGDVEALYRHASSVRGGRCLILFGHSEGFYHAARLIDRLGVRPAGVIGMGAPFESLRGIMWWQNVELLANSLTASDANGDGLVTEAEFKAHHPRTPLSRLKFEEITWPPGFAWPAAGLTADDVRTVRKWRISRYEEWRRNILAKDPAELDSATVAGKVVPRAAFAWWRPFAEDWTPTAAFLAGYDGPISVFYGTKDSSVDPDRQMFYAKAYLGASRVKSMVTPGLGHTLGEHAAYGPMRAEQQSAIVAAAVEMARSCAANE